MTVTWMRLGSRHGPWSTPSSPAPLKSITSARVKWVDRVCGGRAGGLRQVDARDPRVEAHLTQLWAVSKARRDAGHDVKYVNVGSVRVEALCGVLLQLVDDVAEAAWVRWKAVLGEELSAPRGVEGEGMARE